MEAIDCALKRMKDCVDEEIRIIESLTDSSVHEHTNNILMAIGNFKSELARIKPGAIGTLNKQNAYYMHDSKITVFLSVYENKIGKTSAHGSNTTVAHIMVPVAVETALNV